jgi:hypothetical protein
MNLISFPRIGLPVFSGRDTRRQPDGGLGLLAILSFGAKVRRNRVSKQEWHIASFPRFRASISLNLPRAML